MRVAVCALDWIRGAGKSMTDSQMELDIATGPRPLLFPSSRHLNYGIRERRVHELPGIEGLHYFPGFLDDRAQRDAVGNIDASPWRADLERRVQHYGWRYDYQARTVTPNMRLEPLPDWVAELAEHLYHEIGLFDRIPDQAIVNEYEPGQGIALHADKDCFAGRRLGDEIAAGRGNAGRRQADHAGARVGARHGRRGAIPLDARHRQAQDGTGPRRETRAPPAPFTDLSNG